MTRNGTITVNAIMMWSIKRIHNERNVAKAGIINSILKGSS